MNTGETGTPERVMDALNQLQDAQTTLARAYLTGPSDSDAALHGVSGDGLRAAIAQAEAALTTLRGLRDDAVVAAGRDLLGLNS
jgi:hypothetical protein